MGKLLVTYYYDERADAIKNQICIRGQLLFVKSKKGEYSFTVYEFEGINYSDQSDRSIKNMRAVMEEPVNTAALCGHAIYKPGLHPSDIPINVEGIESALGKLFKHPNRIDVAGIVSVFGAESGAKLIQQLISEGKALNCKALAAKIEGAFSYDMPFEFQPATSGLADAGPLAKDHITAKQWYGDYYKK